MKCLHNLLHTLSDFILISFSTLLTHFIFIFNSHLHLASIFLVLLIGNVVMKK